MSERGGYKAMRFDRSTHRYRPIRNEQLPIRKRMPGIALVRVRYDYRRIHVLLWREGRAVNKKHVQRLYREEGLNLRNKRPRRHVTAARCLGRLRPTGDEIWAMDLVSDGLFDGKRFRALTVVDAYTRECLAIEAEQGLKGDAVVEGMECLAHQCGTPSAKIRVDNGPEFNDCERAGNG